VEPSNLLEFYADPESGAWEEVGYQAFPLGEPEPVEISDAAPRVSLHELRDAYDFVIVGSGAGGGVAACVLAEAGASVLVVERGRWLNRADIVVDHLRNHRFPVRGDSTSPDGHPRAVARPDGGEDAIGPRDPRYQQNAITAGGGTRVFGAQAWRFVPDDFRMATTYGVPDGSALADWPIAYEDLAPYYDRVEWELGVAGAEGHGADGPRARGYPMPSFPPSPEAIRLAEAARGLGWTTAPVPLLVNTVASDGRDACVRCGFCVGFACPVDAKNGTFSTVLPRALAAGATIVCETQAVEVADAGTVVLRSGEGERTVRAGRVVLAGGAVETARLLLVSGLGNDWVGRCLQGHTYAGAFGRFDDIVIDGLGPGPSIATRDFSHGNDGVIGGGLLANEFIKLPALFYAWALPPGSPRRGPEARAAMAKAYLRTGHVMGPIQEIPTRDARVRVAEHIRDDRGMPVARLEGVQHEEDRRAATFLATRAAEWLQAAGARETWQPPISPRSLSGGQHQAGTARIAASPDAGATDPFGRVWGTERVFVADGSLHVTNGGANPVLTILALAWRTAEHLSERGSVST
jgi:choline dehydrogenase-like flavoprotein